ncbi:alpha-2-HS-glycoprotein-like [Polyodon spathula]|uniref:alpha-2-HS-glycoprotein-like n=1 Tax=Polyodon spathula TaxID=7913 RepID=UPI001B7F5B41|nr:alpha-2-HS-glycoprotein-like [Polyodon spathula]
MKTFVVLLMLAQAMGSRATGVASTVLRKLDCDSPESEEAAKAAVGYINSHHHHGYKYTLNEIEDVKVIPRVPEGETFIMELELLETKCHIVNPLPVENCTVRSLAETKVEGDCDVALAKVHGTFTVTGFKCKSSPDSAEDVAKRCPDCPALLPLNNTKALDVVSVSLSKFNTDSSEPIYFKLMEVGRLSTQTLPTGPSYFAEYAIVETNCTSDVPDSHHDDCVPLSESLARHGFCTATAVTTDLSEDITVDCDVYAAEGPPLLVSPDPSAPPAVPHIVHHSHHGSTASLVHGTKHYALGSSQDLGGSLFLSSESEQVMTKPKVKRETPDKDDLTGGAPPITIANEPPVVDGTEVEINPPGPPSGPGPIDQLPGQPLPPVAGPILPICPGRIRHF